MPQTNPHVTRGQRKTALLQGGGKTRNYKRDIVRALVQKPSCCCYILITLFPSGAGQALPAVTNNGTSQTPRRFLLHRSPASSQPGPRPRSPPRLGSLAQPPPSCNCSPARRITFPAGFCSCLALSRLACGSDHPADRRAYPVPAGCCGHCPATGQEL